jgi:hypothetical protein
VQRFLRRYVASRNEPSARAADSANAEDPSLDDGDSNRSTALDTGFTLLMNDGPSLAVAVAPRSQTRRTSHGHQATAARSPSSISRD